jgi:hypothetical protein
VVRLIMLSIFDNVTAYEKHVVWNVVIWFNSLECKLLLLCMKNSIF